MPRMPRPPARGRSAIRSSVRSVLPVPESIAAQGVPPIPAHSVEDLLPYENIRTAILADWHPTERRLLIRTRFAESPQLHEVTMPMGARAQLTFYRDPVGEGLYRPNDPNQIVYSLNVGGAENYQLFLLDRRTGRARRFTDGATATSRRSGRATASSSPTRATPATAATWTSTWPIPRSPGSERRVAEVKGDWSPLDWSADGRRLLL